MAIQCRFDAHKIVAQQEEWDSLMDAIRAHRGLVPAVWYERMDELESALAGSGGSTDNDDSLEINDLLIERGRLL